LAVPPGGHLLQLFPALSLCGGSFKSIISHFLYCVWVSEVGWFSTSHGSTEPGETSKHEGSNIVEAVVQ
jgi:hypothetical protein